MDGAHCLVKNLAQMNEVISKVPHIAGKEAVNTPLGRQLPRHHERGDETSRALVLIAK